MSGAPSNRRRVTAFTSLFAATALAALTAGVLLPAEAQAPRNLLENGDGSAGTPAWRADGDATIEGPGGERHFVIRNRGTFQQVITVPPEAAGQFAVFVGRASADRVNADGAITGLPYLYGTIVSASDEKRIVGHLQGQNMLARPPRPDVWVAVSGVFRIPADSGRIVFQMKIAEGAGVLQNGSAARFDDLGLFIYPTEQQARGLIADWPNPALAYEAHLSVAARPRMPRLPAVPLVNPAEPVAGFLRNTMAVLPESEAIKAGRLCSRRSPGTIEGTWTPDAATVQRIESALPPILQAALNKNLRLNARAANADDYYRQYVGLVIGGRRIVYVNGAYSSIMNRPRPVPWGTEWINASDGGQLFFDAVFDAQSGTLLSFDFNGSR